MKLYKHLNTQLLLLLIPPIIQAAKFMKTNLPTFAVGGAVAGAIEGNNDPNEMPTQEFNFNENEVGKKKSEINLDDQSAVPGTVNEYGFEKTSSLLKAGWLMLLCQKFYKANTSI